MYPDSSGIEAPTLGDFSNLTLCVSSSAVDCVLYNKLIVSPGFS